MLRWFLPMSAWLSTVTYIPSVLSLPPPPSPSHPSGLLQRPGLSSLSHAVNSHWLSLHSPHSPLPTPFPPVCEF